MPSEFILGPTVACSCGLAINLGAEGIWQYFEGGNLTCQSCGAQTDLFSALANAADCAFSTFAAVGAEQKHFTISLKPGEVQELDFESRIGADARILWVNYTPKSEGEYWVSPLEIHGNSPIRRWRRKVHVLGRGFGGTPDDFEGQIGVLITYVSNGGDDESWESLVDAFSALHAHNDADVILPANIAVEVRLTRFFKDIISKKTLLAADRIDSFLKDGATYGHQLDVLLPLVCAFTGAPQVPEPVRAGLSRLKKERNAVAHNGVPRNSYDHAAAIEVATSAALGCVYVDYLRDRLLK